MQSRYFTTKMSSLLDSFAIVLSGACLVHCLLLPFVLILFPLLGTFFIDHQSFHQLILVAVVPTTTLALGVGYARHRHKLIALLGLTGVLALMYAAFTLHSMQAHAMETSVTVIGGLMLALAHGLNYRHSGRCGQRRGCRDSKMRVEHEQG